MLMDITLIRWPAEADRLPGLREARVPRLLLVDEDAAPPVVADDFEDWVRVPAPEQDLRARVEGLSRRAEAAGQRFPEIDEHGVVRFNGAHTAVPPVEARLAELLIERFGTVVSRDVLSNVGWPGGHATRNALDVHVLRLRRRLAEAGLSIRTVRSRGYLLEAAEAERLPSAI
jgi:two-component system OmpR family response regulator